MGATKHAFGRTREMGVATIEATGAAGPLKRLRQRLRRMWAWLRGDALYGGDVERTGLPPGLFDVLCAPCRCGIAAVAFCVPAVTDGGSSVIVVCWIDRRRRRADAAEVLACVRGVIYRPVPCRQLLPAPLGPKHAPLGLNINSATIYRSMALKSPNNTVLRFWNWSRARA